MHWITTAGNGSLMPSVLRGDDDDAMNGMAVMYDIGKILTLGGAVNYSSGPASNRAYLRVGFRPVRDARAIDLLP